MGHASGEALVLGRGKVECAGLAVNFVLVDRLLKFWRRKPFVDLLLCNLATTRKQWRRVLAALLRLEPDSGNTGRFRTWRFTT